MRNVKSAFRILTATAVGLLGHQSAAQTQFQPPQLISFSLNSPATVSRGGTVSLRFTAQAGTAKTQSITFVFAAREGRGYRSLRTTDVASGTISAVIDDTWFDEVYRLSWISVTDEWSRTVSYYSDGTIIASSVPITRDPFYGGPSTHSFDLSSVGFTVAGANTTSPVPSVTELVSLTPGSLTPEQTARFRYTLKPGAFALSSISLRFRSLTGVVLFVPTVDSPPLSGEIAFPISTAMVNGRYRLESVLLSEPSGRAAGYTGDGTATVGDASFGYRVAADTSYFTPPEFSVSGASTSPALPRLEAWRRDSVATLSAGGTVRFTYETSAAGFPVSRVTMRLVTPYGGWRDISSDSPSGSFSLPVTADWLAGPYTVNSVTLTDTAGNVFANLPFGGTYPGASSTSRPADSEPFQFTVSGTALPPYFTQQPPDESSAPAGGNVTLVVRAIGIGPVTYQWFRGAPGDTSTPLANNGSTVISAAGDRLTVPVTGSVTYWVRATINGSSVASNAARVVVTQPPVIVVQPVSAAVAPGENATFSVTATGGEPFTYQWRIPSYRGGEVLDQRVLQLNGVIAAQAGEVFCEVRNAAGTVETLRVLLTVFTQAASLRITSEPPSAMAPLDFRLTQLRVEFAGNPPMRYRWQKDGVDLPDTAGFTMQTVWSSTFSPPRTVSPADEGVYRLLVTNGFETVYSREVRLQLSMAPIILTPPAPQTTIPLQSSIILSVAAVGSGTLTYQWRHDGTLISGATRNEFAVFAISNSAAGTYDVIVTNSTGSTTSTPAHVTVSPNPIIALTILQASPDRTARPGETVTFSIVPSSLENIVCRWSKGDRDLRIDSDPSFTLRNVGSSDSGRYQVTLTVPGGSTGWSQTFNLTVAPTQSVPVVTRQPAAATFKRGELAQLNVAVDGRAPLTFQWRLRGVPLPNNDSLYPANEPTLFVRNFDSTKTGAYDVVVSNDTGTVTSARAVLSLPPPSDTGRLMNVSVRANAGGPGGPLIVGFVVGGGTPEPVPLLIRAAGSALAAFGVPDVLANPTATLYSGSSPRFVNDDWSNYPPVASAAVRVGAFPFPFTATRDVAFAPIIPPGAYTVHINSANSSGGSVLAEIYDATPAEEITDQRPRLQNLSVQSNVAKDNPVIAGFVVAGARPKRVLVRGVGPSLGPFGVSGFLVDPRLTLTRGSTTVAENNDWAGDSALRDAFGQVGAFQFVATNSKDAALIATLNPGAYTALVSGNDNTEGLVLVEVYELP